MLWMKQQQLAAWPSPSLQESIAAADGASQLFSDQPPLSSWDLRMVFPLGQSASTAAVALRRGAMLVAFPPMRAVLTATRCFVLLEEVGCGRRGCLVSEGTLLLWPCRELTETWRCCR